MKTIIIIGGGLSGILSAMQLLDIRKDILVKIINASHPIALGVAYSTNDPDHLLNVPAGKMSLFPNLPDHFTDWLISKNYRSNDLANEFIPRNVFGNYITEVFNSYKNNKQLEIIDAEATDVEKQTNKYSVFLSNGKTIAGEKIILAFGNFLPSNPKSKSTSYFNTANYFQDPWNPAYLKNIYKENSILLIGTGLTMVDCVLSILKTGFSGRIYVVSPRGYTPAPHGKSDNYPDFYKELIGRSLLEIFQTVRFHVKKAEKANISWRAVIDALRPHVQKIWIALNTKEKQQFISHIRHIWGIARHRLPVSTFNEIVKLKEKGQLEIIGGRITTIEEKKDNASISILLRKKSITRELIVSRIINCTGPQINYKELKNELVINLLRKKMILSDELNMGIKTEISGKIIQNSQDVSSDFYAIGNLLRGVLWETTALPEIRNQAALIAQQITETE